MRYEQYETLPPYEVSDSLAPRIKELDLAENLADTPVKATRADGAIPVEAPAGSIAIWDGSVWHGNYPREASGERVVLHITYSRLALRPIEDYGHLGDEFLEANPPEMATLLGRTDFFSTTTPTSGVDYRELTRTAAISKR